MVLREIESVLLVAIGLLAGRNSQRALARFACNTYGPTTVAAAGNVAFLAPAHLDDQLIATATERHHAGRSGIYDVTVRLPDATVIAEFRGHSRTLIP